MESVRNLFLVWRGQKPQKITETRNVRRGAHVFCLLEPAVVFVEYLHVSHHFVIHIFFRVHSEMMVELLRARHLCNTVKAKVIMIRPVENKSDIDIFFSHAREVCHPLIGRKSHHAFGRMYGYWADGVKPAYKRMEQLKAAGILSFKKIHQRLVVAGMCLAGPDKLLIT